MLQAWRVYCSLPPVAAVGGPGLIGASRVSEVKAAAVTFTFNSDFSLHVQRHVRAGNRALCDVAATAPYGFLGIPEQRDHFIC